MRWSPEPSTTPTLAIISGQLSFRSKSRATGSSPPPVEFVLPGPFDVSLAPADLARSVSIVVLAMLLVGAPTPIFNSTLSANRVLIGRWLRRKRRRFRRERPAPRPPPTPSPARRS